MNPLRFLGSVIAALALTAAGFATPQTFEGKVRFQITTGKTVIPLTYLMKGGLVREEVETPSGQTAVLLLDFAHHLMTMLIPQQKMYIERALPEAPATADEPQAEGKAPEIQHTGQFETILGYKCEKLILKAGANVTEAWSAEGMGVFMNPGMGGPMGRGRPAAHNAWEEELANGGFFPLRVITRDAAGQEKFKMEALSIDTNAPDDALFAPPPDFKKFEMPAMPGMGGMNPLNR